MKIHTNIALNMAGYLIDEADQPIAIPNGLFKCQIRNRRNDPAAVFEFRTGGVVGGGELTKSTATIEGVLRDVLLFTATQAVLAYLRPGSYYADLVRTDVPLRVVGFRVSVVKGITH